MGAVLQFFVKASFGAEKLVVVFFFCPVVTANQVRERRFLILR